MYNLKKAVSAMLTLIIFCTLFTSCGKSESYVAKTEITTETAADSYHTDSGRYETVAKNSYIDMCIDTQTHTLCVKDLTTDHKWTALCQNGNSYSYAFGVTLFTPSGYCRLNTQDNCVVFGASSFSHENGVLTVKYTLADKKETAEKTADEMTADDIFVSFDVTYKLDEQAVYMNINLDEMKCTKDGFISEISVMPYFGSEKDEAEDYFLIPDNSGAVMHLAEEDAATDSVCVKVYGENLYNTEKEEASASAILPVFGIKRGNSSFCAVITNGDALAEINAQRKDDNSHSRAFSVFTVTETTQNVNGKIKKGPSYSGDITVVYKFLSGKNSDYPMMASACREELIKSSRLSSVTKSAGTNIPFSLTVVGSEKNNPLTTTEQTTDILGILKGKGISNIILNYKGLYNGGTDNGNIYSDSVSTRLGGRSGLENLYDFAKKQGCTLLQGVNILSAGSSVMSSDSLYTISSEKAEYLQRNTLAYNAITSSGLVSRIGQDTASLGKEKTDTSIYSQTEAFSLKLYTVESFKDKFRNFLGSNALDYSDGICVTDAGNILYSDNRTNRQDAMEEVSSMLRAVSNYGTLAVSGGNLYSLYNASIVTDMCFDTIYKESDAYESVPFAQCVLHGSVMYSATPIDAGNPLYRYEMLRYIEYGAVPSYEWIYENENVFCYNGYLLSERISEIVDFYTSSCETLAELADDRIVNHRKITTDIDGKPVQGVYCTEYSDGTEIYVNYTGSIVTTSESIAVGPYDYVKVKR